jgi:hypothetical protein
MEVQYEGRVFLDLALHIDDPAMGVDQLFCDRQSEPAVSSPTA